MSIPKLKNTAAYLVKFVFNLALRSLRSRGISNSLLLQISKASEAGRIHATYPKAPVININCLGKASNAASVVLLPLAPLGVFGVSHITEEQI